MQGGSHVFFKPKFYSTSAVSEDEKHYLCSEFEGAGMVVKVFCAKSLDKKNWNSPRLKELVRKARQSYRRYGDVALFDEYDERAAVFLAVTNYSLIVAGLPVIFEEVVSIRFVPGSGEETLLEDFELFHIAGSPLTDYLKQSPHEKRAILDRLVSISRFCAAEPVPHGEHQNNLHVNLIPSPKRRSTALSFILMNQCFFEQENDARFEYVSGVMRREPMAALARGSGVEELWPRSFPLADDFLVCGPCDISLCRSSEAVYRFPGYFLDKQHLRQLILELVDTDRLTLVTLQQALKLKGAVTDLSASFDALLPHLGLLLTYQGQLPAAPITGDFLRQLVDARVPDVPRLYLGYRVDWQTLLERSVNAFSRRALERKQVSADLIPAIVSFAPSFGG